MNEQLFQQRCSTCANFLPQKNGPANCKILPDDVHVGAEWGRCCAYYKMAEAKPLEVDEALTDALLTLKKK